MFKKYFYQLLKIIVAFLIVTVSIGSVIGSVIVISYYTRDNTKTTNVRYVKPSPEIDHCFALVTWEEDKSLLDTPDIHSGVTLVPCEDVVNHLED